MSANNYLEIRRDGKEYVVRDMCQDICEGDNNGTELKRTKGLKAAIEWAEQYQQDFPVEFGIHFSCL
jgi:hypothetical protein